MTIRQSANDLPVLDAMRGIAALFVVLHHAQFFHGRIGMFAHAYIAVDFFFVLSGFVLCIRYASAFDGGMSTADFLRKRVARLAPVIIAGIALGAAVSLIDGAPLHLVLVQAITQGLFIPVFAAHFPVYPLNPVQWSLLVELFANALHASTLRKGRGIAAAVLGVGMIALFAIAYRHAGLAVGDLRETWLAGFGRVVLPYGLGVAAGWLWLRTPQKASRIAGIASLLLLPLALWVGTLPIGRSWLFDPLMAATVFPAIVWMGSRATPPRTMLPLAAVLGLMSYPLYAFHIPLIRLGELVAAGLPAAHVAPARALAILAAIALAWGWTPAANAASARLRALRGFRFPMRSRRIAR